MRESGEESACAIATELRRAHSDPSVTTPHAAARAAPPDRVTLELINVEASTRAPGAPRRPRPHERPPHPCATPSHSIRSGHPRAAPPCVRARRRTRVVRASLAAAALPCPSCCPAPAASRRSPTPGSPGGAGTPARPRTGPRPRTGLRRRELERRSCALVHLSRAAACLIGLHLSPGPDVHSRCRRVRLAAGGGTGVHACCGENT